MDYYVYILVSRSRRIYTGVTNDLMRRVWEHKQGTGGTFTSKYRVNRLAYYEQTTSIYSAIEREKEIKSMLREKKIAIIEEQNVTWMDLSPECTVCWFETRYLSARLRYLSLRVLPGGSFFQNDS